MQTLEYILARILPMLLLAAFVAAGAALLIISPRVRRRDEERFCCAVPAVVVNRDVRERRSSDGKRHRTRYLTWTYSAHGRQYVWRANAKMQRLVELVGQILEKNEKAIVASNWTTPIEGIHPYLGGMTDLALMTGNTTSQERQAEKRRFQENPNCGVICGTIGVMGVGLTLTAACRRWERAWT